MYPPQSLPDNDPARVFLAELMSDTLLGPCDLEARDNAIKTAVVLYKGTPEQCLAFITGLVQRSDAMIGTGRVLRGERAQDQYDRCKSFLRSIEQPQIQAKPVLLLLPEARICLTDVKGESIESQE